MESGGVMINPQRKEDLEGIKHDYKETRSLSGSEHVPLLWSLLRGYLPQDKVYK